MSVSAAGAAERCVTVSSATLAPEQGDEGAEKGEEGSERRRGGVLDYIHVQSCRRRDAASHFRWLPLSSPLTLPLSTSLLHLSPPPFVALPTQCTASQFRRIFLPLSTPHHFSFSIFFPLLAPACFPQPNRVSGSPKLGGACTTTRHCRRRTCCVDGQIRNAASHASADDQSTLPHHTRTRPIRSPPSAQAGAFLRLVVFSSAARLPAVVTDGVFDC